jgi:hypothetical protein
MRGRRFFVLRHARVRASGAVSGRGLGAMLLALGLRLACRVQIMFLGAQTFGVGASVWMFCAACRSCVSGGVMGVRHFAVRGQGIKKIKFFFLTY